MWGNLVEILVIEKKPLSELPNVVDLSRLVKSTLIKPLHKVESPWHKINFDKERLLRKVWESILVYVQK